MPEQMFKYRAAAFFARAYCPEVLCGMMTYDEVQDMGHEPKETKKAVDVDLEGSEPLDKADDKQIDIEEVIDAKQEENDGREENT